MSSRRGLAIVPIVILFLATNLTLISLPLPASIDTVSQEKWGNFALVNSITSLYSENMTDYPPFYLYAFYFNAWLNHQLNPRNLTAQGEPRGPSYAFISKLIPISCNLLTGLVLFLTLRKRDLNWALVAASLYLFNPAIMFNTSYWGQVDSSYTLFILLSLKFLTDRHYLLSTAFASVAVLTKVQSLFFLPVLAFGLISGPRPKQLLQSISGGLLVVLVVLSPFLTVITSIASTLSRNFGQYPYATVNALNLWFLLFSYHFPEYMQSQSDALTYLGISLKMAGYIILGTFTVLVLYQLRREKLSLALGATSLAFATFMLPTEIHERYLFPFFALFLMIPAVKRTQIAVYGILTITYLVNLMLVLNFDGFYLTFGLVRILLIKSIGYWSLDTVTYAIAGINVAAFAYFVATGVFRSLIGNIKCDISRIDARLREITRLTISYPRSFESSKRPNTVMS
ncbi:MAG TPA: hypothetical protein VEG61_03975 [Candidatus Dormibacteraeota bacterium]|nr:hypothetical protein [Candidatus Dormibacteraeota bacterium]